jgi:hypothetical protein
MYLQKVISGKNCVKNYFFAGILKVYDEKSRIRIQDPDLDTFLRSMDPRIRIRIHPKMSWIRNTVYFVPVLGIRDILVISGSLDP